MSVFRDFFPLTDPLKDKVVLVTGGTGSFGQRFVKTVLQRFEPRKLIIFSRDELKQYEMRQKFDEEFDPHVRAKLRYFLGDVRDRTRLELAFRGVDIVIHAAALKQVPAAEYNPSECIATNVYGAENVVWAALTSKVKKIIALSTDKACSPINLYGATKLASDKIFVAANNLSGDIGTRFCAVRYGNVVGSRGSVVPLYEKLIAKGNFELPVTDVRMTRFWITLDQGVAFVLSSLEIMQGGEIFVPKIPATHMTDLVKAMHEQATIKLIGIRPGEKLHEMMISQDDARVTVALDDRFVIEPEFVEYGRKPFAKVRGARLVDEAFSYASDNNPERLDPDGIKSLLKAAHAA